MEGLLLLGVEVNREEKRFEWAPGELEENVFAIIAELQTTLGVKVKGNPYRIDENNDLWAWDFS